MIKQMNENIRFYEKYAKKVILMDVVIRPRLLHLTMVMERLFKNAPLKDMHYDKEQMDRFLSTQNKRFSAVNCTKCEFYDVKPYLTSTDGNYYLAYDPQVVSSLIMDHSHHNHEQHMHVASADMNLDNVISSPNQGMDHSMMMNHAMAFHFGAHETILFDFWRTSNGIEMFFSCIGVIAICILHQTVIFLRNLKKSQQSHENLTNGDVKRRFQPSVIKFAFADCAIYFIQLLLAYVLMLIFMTFNVYLCLSVLIGEILGRFVFLLFFPEVESPTSSCM
ncbi:hypothetical protein WR25_17554 [Diploscapter pachys]|uniref:Copper transport protein n=1 Tax=Diploscapter pachys TaxID=2018661 RepID=A0A2A2KQZ1_9BILA|nr:hypothetical protein WR25_17554 [Diploscapter pachys]